MFTINCKVYPFDIIVCLGDNRKKISKFLRKNSTEEDSGVFEEINLSVGTSIMLPSGCTILYLKKYPNSIGGLAILQHEIFHCVFFILEYVGIRYSKKSDEAFSYLIEYITKEIYNKLNIKFEKHEQT